MEALGLAVGRNFISTYLRRVSSGAGREDGLDAQNYFKNSSYRVVLKDAIARVFII